MGRKKLVWISAVLAALVAAAAGTAATAAEKGSQAVTLNLVAYSTPRPVMTKLIEEFRKTPAGVRHQHPRVVRRLVGPGRRRWPTGCPPTS